MSTATGDEVEVSDLAADLDLLDDPHIHAVCAEKFPPENQPYAEYEGLCGRKATMIGTLGKERCPECVEWVEKCRTESVACPTCGKLPKDHRGI